MMDAKKAKEIADKVQSKSDISAILIKVRAESDNGEYSMREYGMTNGQREALVALGFKVLDEFIMWK